MDNQWHDLSNVMSGVAGIVIQAGAIDGNIHIHLPTRTITAPAAVDDAQDITVTRVTGYALKVALLDLDDCLLKLGVPAAELPTTKERFIRSVLHQLGEIADDRIALGMPRDLESRIRRFAENLLAFVEPERIMADHFYLSRSKVVTSYRAYRQHLATDETEKGDGTSARFLQLYNYFSDRELLTFSVADALLNRPPTASGNHWVYFSGEFTLRQDSVSLDQLPEALAAIESRTRSSDGYLVSSILGSPDPYFYPYLKFDGTILGRPTEMTISRKYLAIRSGTVRALARLLTGEPAAIAGFGTFLHRDQGTLEIHPIAMKFS